MISLKREINFFELQGHSYPVNLKSKLKSMHKGWYLHQVRGAAHCLLGAQQYHLIPSALGGSVDGDTQILLPTFLLTLWCCQSLAG